MREVRLRLPSPPLADMTTGLVRLYSGTQVQVPPVKATPAMDSSRMLKDKGALPSEIVLILRRRNIFAHHGIIWAAIGKPLPLRQGPRRSKRIPRPVMRTKGIEQGRRPVHGWKEVAPRKVIRTRFHVYFISSVIVASIPFALWFLPG